MASSNSFIPLLLLFFLRAIVVQSDVKASHILSTDMGLTEPCISRVLATCAQDDSNSESEQTDTLEDLSPGQRNILHFLKEMLQKNHLHEDSVVQEMEKSIQSMKETVFQSLKEFEVKMQGIEDLVKSSPHENFPILEIQKNMAQMQQKILSQVTEAIDLSNKETMLRFSEMTQTLLNKIDPPPKNCAELLERCDTESGVRTVYPRCLNHPVTVFCDQKTDGGGWTVFQRRDNLTQREDFDRNWDEYVRGFGNVSGEFWLGLDAIYALVSGPPMEMRVDLEDFEGEKRWGKHTDFSIDDAADKYKLHIGGYSGNVADSMARSHNYYFSTKDNDNDKRRDRNCAQEFRGGWWYKSCLSVNLNGFQFKGWHESFQQGIIWNDFRGDFYSLKKSSMMVRPKK